MNKDQLQNIQEAFDKVFDALFGCWSYMHLLRGLQAGAKDNPECFERAALAVDIVYRSAFDALFAAFGTIVDSTKGTYSLPSIITLIRRYTHEQDEIRALLAEVEQALQTDGEGPLFRMRNWRHKVVAHHTKEGRDPEFHPRNKLHLEEVEALLKEVEYLANRISVKVLKQGTDCKSGGEKEIRKQAYSLLNPE